MTNAHLWETVQEAEHTMASHVNIPMKYFFPSKFPLDLLQINRGRKKYTEDMDAKKLTMNGNRYIIVFCLFFNMFQIFVIKC